MPTLTAADGVRIVAHELGGRGPDLVLAHATGFHGRTWMPLARHLRERARCVAFDERGHGDSVVSADETFDWRSLARDVLAVVDGLGLSRPLGAGHSCGAALLLLAEEARPGTFASLYCFEPIMATLDHPPRPGGPNPMAAGARRRRETFASRSAALEHLAQRPAFSSLDPAALRAYVDYGFDDLEDGRVRLKCRAETEARVYEHGLSHDAFANLHRVGCPVTLACGELTDAVGPGTLEKQASRLREARIDVVAGLGHLGPLEDPAAVASSMGAAFGLW